MQRWFLLLRAHNHIWLDRGWPLLVRHDACKAIKRCMIELGELKPLPTKPIPSVLESNLQAHDERIKFVVKHQEKQRAE